MLLFRAGFCRERIRLPDSNSRIPFGMNQRRGVCSGMQLGRRRRKLDRGRNMQSELIRGRTKISRLTSIILRIRHNTCQRYAVLGGP